jgi:ribosomal protein L13
MGRRPIRPTLSRMKTYAPRPEHIEHRWYVIDASGAVLGRLASEVASILRGKHKPIFAPHMDTGDHVVIVNASKVELSGGKDMKKFAYRHSGHPGGITATSYGRLMAERPAFELKLGDRPAWSGLPESSPPAPEPKPRASTAKRTTAKRTAARPKSTAKPAAKATSAKRTTARSKTTAKPKATTVKAKTTAKRPAARKPTRRPTKED